MKNVSNPTFPSRLRHGPPPDASEEFARFRDEVRRRFAGVDRDIGELKQDVGQLKTDVAVLKTDVAVLKIDVAVLKTDVAVLKTDVGQLKTDVTQLKTDVSQLKSDVGQLKLDVGSLKGEFLGLAHSVQSLQWMMGLLAALMIGGFGFLVMLLLPLTGHKVTLSSALMAITAPIPSLLMSAVKFLQNSGPS